MLTNRHTIDTANEGQNQLFEEILSDGSRVYGVRLVEDENEIILDCPTYTDAVTVWNAIKHFAIIN